MASTRIVQLRPYQQQAISDLRMAYRGGARAPLLVSVTGSDQLSGRWPEHQVIKHGAKAAAVLAYWCCSDT